MKYFCLLGVNSFEVVLQLAQKQSFTERRFLYETVILDGKTTNPGDLSWDFLKNTARSRFSTAHRAKNR